MILQKTLSSMKRLINRIHFPAWSAPLAMLGVCILAFGLLIPRLGFYWDDWETMLVGKMYPLSEYWKFFSDNRPLSAWTYILFTSFLGTRPLAWQIFSLLLRWLSVASMAWAFSCLWPNHRRQVTYAALLFAVYPIFVQQPISVTYHQDWTEYILFFISLGAMIQAERKPRYFGWFTALALLAFLLDLAISEYFLGEQFLRPVLLWLVVPAVGMSTRKRLWKVFKHWLPYLLVFIAFIIWRVVFSFEVSATNSPVLLFELVHKPLAAIQTLAEMAGQDLLYIFVSSWYKTLTPDLIDLRSSASILAILVSIITALVVAFFLARWDVKTDSDAKWQRQAALIGFLGALFGVMPIWATGRHVDLNLLHTDRFADVSMFGAALLVVAILEWLLKNDRQRLVVLSILIGLAVGLHLRTANDYRWSWTTQTRFYWQLFWRAPEIQPGTAIVSENEIAPFVSPSYAINMLYHQPGDTRQFAYLLYKLGRDNFSNPEKLKQGLPLNEKFREFTFTGNSLNSLVVFYNPPNCLWVLSPADQQDPSLSLKVREALSISNLSRIGTDQASAQQPFADVFGSELEHGWCYLYQKADLARQTGDWQTVVKLGDQALAQGFLLGNSPHEWLPFIEGYLRTSQWQKAEDATVANYGKDHAYQGRLCKLWNDANPVDANGKTAYQAVVKQLECPPAAK
jgi:hypothetical protein